MNAREGGVLFLTAWAARLDWDGAELDVLRFAMQRMLGSDKPNGRHSSG